MALCHAGDLWPVGHDVVDRAMKISARGVTGYLIYCGDHRYRFRVYTDAGEFTDYDILHSDLEITITDTDAVFYSDDTGNRLDHSPQTLGEPS